MADTKSLYNEHASKWARSSPTSLSDFTGRPPVIELCGDIDGFDVLDLGCGEGYVTRALLKQSVKTIKAIDLSSAMIQAAKEQCQDPRVEFATGNATSLDFEDESFDLVLGVFVYNYLFIKDTFASFKEVYRVLRPGGSFVFSVPHPAFPFLERSDNGSFHFDFNGKGYFSSRDIRAEGVIDRIDGVQLPVQMCHKTIEDYFRGFTYADFDRMPIVKELGVKSEHIEMNPAFFGKIADTPLHIAIKVTK